MDKPLEVWQIAGFVAMPMVLISFIVVAVMTDKDPAYDPMNPIFLSNVLHMGFTGFVSWLGYFVVGSGLMWASAVLSIDMAQAIQIGLITVIASNVVGLYVAIRWSIRLARYDTLTFRWWTPIPVGLAIIGVSLASFVTLYIITWAAIWFFNLFA